MAFAASTTVKVALVLLILGLIIFIVGFSAPYWMHNEYSESIPVYRGNRLTAASRRERARMTRADIENYRGLWKGCHKYDYTDPFTQRGVHYDRCVHLVEDVGHLGDRHRATQFFECVGLIASIISLIIFIIWCFMDSWKDRRLFPILASVLALIAGGCAILGAIIFGTADYVTAYLSWAFALAIVGGCFFALAGIIGLVGVFMNK